MSTDHAKPMGGSDEYAEMKKMGGRKGNKRAQNHDGGSSLMQMGGGNECQRVTVDVNSGVKTFDSTDTADKVNGICPADYEVPPPQGGRRRRRKSKKALKVSRKSRKSRRGRKSRKN
jgi:hypothetical protein